MLRGGREVGKGRGERRGGDGEVGRSASGGGGRSGEEGGGGRREA